MTESPAERDPRLVDLETGETMGWPLEIKLVVSTEAILRTEPDVFMRMVERPIDQYREAAKDLYRHYHPGAIFADETPKPEGRIEVRTEGGLSITVKE